MSPHTSPISPPRAPSIATSAISVKMRNLALQGKPAVTITLKGESGRHGSYITSFSTLDKLEGEVSVTAPHDTRFDDIEIAFVGRSSTFVDRISSAPTVASRSDATHQFLRLRQPIDDSAFPLPRIAAAGHTYRFPFTFVVPTRLLPKLSSQSYANDQVQDAHLRLPPSMGDTCVAGHSGKLLDDLTPAMAKVVYAIQVTVTRQREADGKIVPLVQTSKKVRVKPAFEEQPPLVVPPNDTEYQLRRERTVRKGIFKGRLGTLVMETQQPRSLRIPGARSSDSPAITTSAKVMLRFDPADADGLPPKLGSLSSKLKVTTFFASTPRRQFPSREQCVLDISQGHYSETLHLSSRCVAGTQWSKHAPALAACRRDSGISDCSSFSSSASSVLSGKTKGVPAPSESYVAGRPFYTAYLLVPIQLPDDNTFIPTFHSCLISRVYRLSLALSLASATKMATPITLKVPVQVSACASVEGAERAAIAAADMDADADIDDLFAPRSVAPPGFEYLERSGRMRPTARTQTVGGADAASPPGYDAAALTDGQAREVETVVRMTG